MKKLILIGAMAASLLIGSGVGHAAVSCPTANSCNGSETKATTIEPILTRSSLARVESNNSPAPNRIGNANIMAYSISATGGVLRGSATVRTPLIRTLGNLDAAPYGGQHIMLMFQTNEFEDQAEVIGKTATGTDVEWGPNGYNADRFHWFLHYGWTPNKGGPATCGLGIYDPTGALITNTPTPVGQLFSVLGEDNDNSSSGPINTACSVSADGKTISWTQPYRYTWQTRTLLPRSKQIVNAGETIRHIKAFSWLDHEIGGPQPVGLILGWTWYTDSLPETAYQIGAVAGDPNPNTLWTPKCLGNELGSNPVTGQPGPCTAANPVGSGFVLNGTQITAA